MGLQELPTELMLMICDCLIVDQAIQITARQRTVCRLFRDCIPTDLILKRSPISAFCNKYGYRLISKHLQARTKDARNTVSTGALLDLPKYIGSLLDSVYSFSGHVAGAVRDRHEAIICDAIMFQYTRGEDWGCGEAIITLVLKGDPGNQYVDEQPTEDIKDYYKKAGQQAKDEVEILVIHFKEYQREAPTAIAALIGDEAALGSLLHSSRRSDHEELMWEYSALGEPIAAAAYAGSVNIIRNALKDLTEKELRLDCRPANYLMEVVDIALDQGHIHAATEFLNLGTDYFYVLEKEMFVRWLAKIVNSGDAAAISALLELTHKAGTGICVQAYETACRLGHVDVAELFIKKNVLKPNQLYVYCEDSYPIQRALLLMADGRSCAQLIKKLIHLGADPDGPRVLRKDLHCSPLFVAVEKRKWAAVAVLLNHGANLDLPAFTHVFLGIKMDTLTSIQRHFEHGRKHLLPARVWSELARLLPRRTTGQLRPALS